MFTSAEIEKFSMVYDQPMRALENQIMADIVRRIRINGKITRSADWQINRLYELGAAKEDINKAIATSLNISEKDVEKLYSDITRSGYARDAGLYQVTGAKHIPFKDNAELQQLIEAVASQTSANLKNITGSLGFAVRKPDGTLGFQKIADYYQKTLDNAIMGIASGAFDFNTVIKRVVKEMTDSGLRSIDYETGRKNRVDVAARRAIVTGFAQLTSKVNDSNAEELGTEYFEVSWHGGARPEHQVWQGRVYTKKQLKTVCGLGSVTGLCGANCYHNYYPFIKGVSKRTYTDEELDRMNTEENIPVEYNGKQYTKYEALQRQRRLETVMRAERQQIKLLEDGGADERDVISARAKYRGTSHEYATFSKTMGLPQQRERITVDGLRNIGSGKYKQPVDKSGESGIIRESSKPKPITEITDKAIESVPKVNISGYTDEQCAMIQKQHKELLEYSREHNDNKEVAFVFDGSLESRKEFMGSDDKIDFGRGLYGSNITVLHNHPRNSSYSVTDIIFFGDNSNVKTLTIVKNNGKVEYLTKNEKFDSAVFKLEYDRLYRKIVKNGTDSEKDKFVKNLLNKSKSGVIWSERT